MSLTTETLLVAVFPAVLRELKGERAWVSPELNALADKIIVRQRGAVAVAELTRPKAVVSALIAWQTTDDVGNGEAHVNRVLALITEGLRAHDAELLRAAAILPSITVYDRYALSPVAANGADRSLTIYTVIADPATGD